MTVPVVLVHGLATSSARTWGETGWLDLLTDAGRLPIPIDLPGHGTARAESNIADSSDVEAMVLAQLPEGPVDAIGFSLGARVLLGIACANPSTFRRLVVAGVGRNLFESDPERSARIAAAIGGVEDPEDPEARHFHALASSPDVDRDVLGKLLRASWPDLDAEKLGQISCPVLVVLGDADFAGPADRLLDALPNVTFKSLRNVDHFATPKSIDFIDSALTFVEDL